MTATAVREPAPARKLHDLREIPLDQLQPHPKNRKRFDQAELDALAASLKERGQLTPAIVRLSQAHGRADHYQLLAGERRWRAAKIAGLPALLCIVRELDDLGALQILAMENNQRTDLHPMEEAELFEAFTKIDSLSQERIAQLVGRDKHYVRDRLQLLKLTPAARAAFQDGRFTIKHANILARCQAADQAELVGTAKRPGELFKSKSDQIEAPGFEGVEAVTVGDLQGYVARNIKLNVKSPELALEFPEAAAAVVAAQATKRDVVDITYDSWSQGKDGPVLTLDQWRRADGIEDPREPRYGAPRVNKVCAHAILGFVALGRGRGSAFPVCIAKGKCEVHWKKEPAAAPRAAAAGSKRSKTPTLSPAAKADQLKRERWSKAEPALLKALADAFRKAPAHAQSEIGKLVLDELRTFGTEAKLVPPGKTAEDLVRHVAFGLAAQSIDYEGPDALQKSFKRYGLDAAAIVDKAVPPEPEKKAEAKPAKKLAGDVRRAKAKKKAKR